MPDVLLCWGTLLWICINIHANRTTHGFNWNEMNKYVSDSKLKNPRPLVKISWKFEGQSISNSWISVIVEVNLKNSLDSGDNASKWGIHQHFYEISGMSILIVIFMATCNQLHIDLNPFSLSIGNHPTLKQCLKWSCIKRENYCRWQCLERKPHGPTR